MRALLLLLALAGPATAQDGCLLACDVITTGEGATARFEAALGIDLPPGAKVVGLVEGGFQDAFVQARIEVEREAMDATLRALGVERDAIRPAPGTDLGPPGPSWWEDKVQEDDNPLAIGQWFAPATLHGFAHAVVGVGPGEGRDYTLLLWAFQT